MAIIDPSQLDEEAPSQVLYNPHSAYGKEMRKFEQFPSWYTPPGTKPGNPYVYRPYPKAMYKAAKKPNGKIVCMETQPNMADFMTEKEYVMAVREMEVFNQRCFKTVANEDEERMAKNDGWRNDPNEAIALIHQLDKERGNAAAEREYREQGMSEKAKAEVNAYEQSTHEHVADVPSAKERNRK